MPFELTSAFLLLVLACFCAVTLVRTRTAVPAAAISGPNVEEWRSAALQHFHQHKELERTVAQALVTPGAVSGRARGELLAAVGINRVDTFA